MSIHSTTARLAHVDSYTHTTQTQHQQMNKQVQAIRAKVERLKKENESIRCSANEEYCRGYDDAFVDFLKFIDSLPDEQPSKDLETEITTWIQSHLEIKNKQFEIYREPMTKWADAIARHFYEYGQQSKLPASKDLEEAAETFNREDAAGMWDYEGKTEGEIVESAFIAGAKWGAEHLKK